MNTNKLEIGIMILMSIIIGGYVLHTCTSINSAVATTDAGVIADVGKTVIAPTNIPNNVQADNPVNLVKSIIEAARSGKWALLVGLAIMLITWLLNTILKSKIPSKILPWIAIGLGVISQSAFALAQGSGWVDAIIGGICMGLTAAGSYSAIGRWIPGLNKKKKS